MKELGPLSPEQRAREKQNVRRLQGVARGFGRLMMHAGVPKTDLGELGGLLDDDAGSNRVLVVRDAINKANAAPADLVLGQPSFDTIQPNDTPSGGVEPYACPTPAPASQCLLETNLLKIDW